MADSGHTTPTAGKDMKNVIAQFQQGKGNLRPAGGAKPKPQTGLKSSINEHADTSNDAAKLPRKLKSDNQEGTRNSVGSEAANPFKVALKPVARTTSTGTGGVVAAKNFANHKAVTEAGDKSVTSPKAETSEPAPKVSAIANKSKMFEQQQQKQPEVVTPSSPTASTKPRFSANSNALKAPVVPKPQTKPTPATDPIQKPNGTTAPSANKWKKPESKPDELKPTDQKPDTKKEFPFRKAVQDETKTGDDAAADDNKAGTTNFATMRPVKATPSTTKPSFPVTGATLPKQFKPPMVASKINKATVEPEKEDEDDEQPKIPPKPSNKSDQPKIAAKTMEDLLQPRIPPRSTDKAEQAKPFAKTTEDIDQPKVPMRRDQKKLDESTAAVKHPLPDSRKAEENKQKKGSDLYDQNANKVGGKGVELPPRNNMGRPLPKPAEKQYRLLPVPKQKGKAPKKKAKPPVVDLSKYAAYATPKSVVPPPLATKQLSVEAYDDGDDIYEDCDNMDVPTIKQSSRISEYSEEEEAKLEKNAKLKTPSTTTTNTDNYGKMFNAPSVDEYDDDEIYQEID